MDNLVRIPMTDASVQDATPPRPGPSDPWPSVLVEIQGQVSPQQFETWFRPVRSSVAGLETLELFVPTPFAREGLIRNYVSLIRSTLKKSAGWKEPVVVVEVDGDTGAAGRPTPAFERIAPPAAAAASVAKKPEQRVEGLLQLNDDYVFEQFVVGPHNALAEAAARAVVRNPGRIYNPLFIHGRCGFGKTHLLQAMCHALLRERPDIRIAYVSCETFINQFIAAVEKADVESFRARFRRLDVLIIDDVHFLANKERSQDEFFHTFNDLHQLSKQIVLSSDSAPPEIPSISERLVSRFRQGMVCQIEAPLYETRVQIANRRAEAMGRTLPPEVAEFIAKHVQSSVRELCGAVVKVIGVATLMKVDIDLAMAREALGELLLDRRPRVTLDAIVHAVTEHFSLRRVDLQSKRRTKPLTEPRQMCMFLARKLTNLSLEEIGAYFGGRDHSTVLYGADRTAARYATDVEFRRLVDQMAAHAGGSLRG
jgi:chromosomal replication initiator protein